MLYSPVKMTSNCLVAQFHLSSSFLFPWELPRENYFYWSEISRKYWTTFTRTTRRLPSAVTSAIWSQIDLSAPSGNLDVVTSDWSKRQTNLSPPGVYRESRQCSLWMHCVLLFADDGKHTCTNHWGTCVSRHVAVYCFVYLHHRNEKYDVIEKKRGGNHFVINFCCLLVAKCSEPRRLLELPFLLVGLCSVNSKLFHRTKA